MSKDTEIKIIPSTHPLEDELGIEPNTTMVETVVRPPAPQVLTPEDGYDNVDEDINDAFQEVYDAAMTAFDMQTREAENVEGQYKARNGEIAAQFLNTALNAAKERAGVKKHKDKIKVAANKKSAPRTLHQNVIVADRNDLLKDIMGAGSPEIEEKES